MTRRPPRDDSDLLRVENLIAAYRQGWFPMADPLTGRIAWYCPDPRAVLPIERFHVPRSLAREVRRGAFEIRFDTAFEAVIRACSEPRDSDRLSWIDERLIRAYAALNRAGHAMSVEAWREGRLVGGLYGVKVGTVFCGESMFSRPHLGGTNASKVCLVHLVDHLRGAGFSLVDSQFLNPHMSRFGFVEIPRAAYLAYLKWGHSSFPPRHPPPKTP